MSFTRSPRARGAVALTLVFAGAMSVRTPAAPPPPTPSENVTVSTFAGTGVSGNLDGPLATATFASPSGLATGTHGEIYVVDKALNTLRVIEGGRIRTIAGTQAGDPLWRPGGYHDGPIAQAEFAHPEGVAVAPDGSIIVADTGNLAVRKIKDGVVTTLAGGPGRFGTQDGPLASATFKFPVAVAVDAAGNVYVADQQNAIREISSDGVVSTLPIPNVKNASGIAVSPGRDPGLWIADETALIHVDLASTGIVRLDSDQRIHGTEWGDAHVPAGRPYAIAADGPNDAAYTDVSENAVYRINDRYVRGLAGGDPFDPNVSGGYADGRGNAARFYAPLGITKIDAGWVVSDAGNHRLRLVSPVDDRQPVNGDGRGMKRYYSGTRPAVAVVGNSQVWADSEYAQSIPGGLHGLMPNVDVIPLKLAGADEPTAIAEFCAQVILPLERVEAVAYIFNDSGVTRHSGVSLESLLADDAWEVTLASQFAAAKAKLGAAAPRLFVVYIPTGYETSPNESSFLQQIEMTKASLKYDEVNELHARVAKIVAASGFDLIDAWPIFRDAERLGEGPLFGPLDSHLAPDGRALVTHVIAAELRRRHIPAIKE